MLWLWSSCLIISPLPLACSGKILATLGLAEAAKTAAKSGWRVMAKPPISSASVLHGASSASNTAKVSIPLAPKLSRVAASLSSCVGKSLIKVRSIFNSFKLKNRLVGGWALPWSLLLFRHAELTAFGMGGKVKPILVLYA
jgi:hypothetical protein